MASSMALSRLSRTIAEQSLEELNTERCLQCDGDEFVTLPDSGDMACLKCACLHRAVREEVICSNITPVAPKFTGGGLTKMEHDREAYETSIRSRVAGTDLEVGSEIIKTAAGFLADRKKYPRKKRTQRLFAKALVEAGELEGAKIDRVKIAEIFEIKKITSVRNRSSDPLLLAGGWLAECVEIARDLNMHKFAGDLEKMLRSERRSAAHFCKEIVERCASRGICARHEIATRAFGACAVLVECLHGDVQVLADVLGKRRASVTSVANKIGEKWQEFQDIFDRYHLEYYGGVSAEIANEMQRSRLPLVLKLLDELSEIPGIEEIRDAMM